MISEIKREFLAAQGQLETMLSKANNTTQMVAKDAADGLFYANALERVDATLHKPLASFFWSEALPILYGGGAVEFASFFRINYLAHDSNKFTASGNQNVISEVRCDIEKVRTLVRAYTWKMDIGWIDQMKLDQVAFDMQNELDSGVRYYYNQKLDDIAFFGFVDEGVSDAYGIANNADIVTTTSTKNWSEMTALEVFEELNALLYSIYTRTGYSRERKAQPNHLLVPTSLYGILGTPITVGSTPLAMTVQEYFKSNNVGRLIFGLDDIMIVGVPYLEGLGANSTGRIIAYPFDASAARLPLPMDLTRGATMFDTTQMTYSTPYVTFIGQPQFIYPVAFGYLDNAAESNT